MSFDYDELKREEEDKDPRKSLSPFSDLFVGISFIFLFLFVMANINAGIRTISHNLDLKSKEEEKQKEINDYSKKLELMEIQKAQEIDEMVKNYENRLEMFQVEAQDYLKKNNKKKELKKYEEVMAKLTLLRDEKKREKEELLQKALKVERKETELNKYQAMISSIVHSNLVLKSKVNSVKEDYREEKKAKNRLKKKRVQFEARVKRKYEKEFKKELKAHKKEIVKENQIYKKKLSDKLAQELEIKKEKVDIAFQNRQDDLEKEFEKKDQKLSLEYDNKLKESVQEVKKDYGRKVASIKESSQEEINQYVEDKNRALASMNAAKAAEQKAQMEYQNISEKLKFAQAPNNVLRGGIAQALQEAFGKANIKAEIDPETGDFSIPFHKHFFRSDKYHLTRKMKAILKKVIPIYAEAVFSKEHFAKRISDVEIIGFSSPTYKGKYVDPRKLNKKNRDAIEYNLDLSYKRAKSIFDYIFNVRRMLYKYQSDMFKKAKVTGRSFLDGESVKKRIKYMGIKRYCRKYNCLKQQKVILRFNLL